MSAENATTTEHDKEQAAAALVNAFSRQLGALALGIHEAAANIDLVAQQVARQLKRLRDSAQMMAETNRQIDSATETADRAAEAGHTELAGSRRAVGAGTAQVATLADAVERMEQRLDGIAASLKEWPGFQAPSTRSRGRPISWRSMPRSRRRGPARRAGALPWWRPR